MQCLTQVMYSFLNKKRITLKGVNNLKNYKYSGGDGSFMYKHVMGPLAQVFLDKFVPEWIAPNTLTTLGLLSILVPHIILFILYEYDLKPNYPPWIAIALGISMLVYQHLDNLDGKQARRTENSSPLGLLFDHGVDAIVVCLSAINFFRIVGLGNTPLAAAAFSIASFNFYYPTLEQYYLGTLDLPIINGATDGQLLFQALYYLAAYLGAEWWQEEAFGVPRNYVLVLTFGVLGIPGIITSLIKIISKLGFGACRLFLDFLTEILLMGTLILLAYFSPTKFYERQAIVYMYIIGISHAKYMTYIQLNHVSEQRLKVFSFSIWIPTLILLINMGLTHALRSSIIDEEQLVCILFAYTLLDYCISITTIIRELTEILDIYAFRINHKKIGMECKHQQIEFSESNLIDIPIKVQF